MWKKSVVEWTEDDTAFISVVFSWNLQEAYQRAVWYKMLGYRVRVGGPAIHGTTMFNDIAEVGGHIPDVVSRHNPNATFTTRGCPNKCAFCLVPKIEPVYKEIKDFPIRPIVCDNNILAASNKHFDMVCEKLSDLENVDFNQGLDSRLLTKEKANKLSSLNTKAIRLAFDSRSYENYFTKAFQLLVESGTTPKHITVYVLINFRETQEDALYRLEKVREMGGVPFPMRYQPVDAKTQNAYLSPNWNESYLKDVIRYYSRLTWLGHIPFSEYRHIKEEHPENQISLY